MSLQREKVNQYYNASKIDYDVLWTGKDDLAIHFGYWDKDVKNHQESLLRLNKVVSDLVKIQKDHKVLDAGCGYGGSAIWLAKNIGCRVHGVNVVPFQINIAKEHAKRLGLAKKVSFSVEDYAHTSFQGSEFDVVWGLESIVHASSKPDFAKEAYRLLKKGGRIAICEYMLRDKPPLTASEQRVIAPWLKGWAMPSLLTENEYKSILTKSGFNKIKTYDLTYNVKPSLARLKKLLKIGLPVAKLLRSLRLFGKSHFGNVEASFYQCKALEMGLWRYIVIVAEK